MSLTRYGVIAPILMIFVSHVLSSPSIMQLRTSRTSDGKSRRLTRVNLYCESWRFTVETNDAGNWSQIPENCVDFVKDYITGEIYSFESEAVADNALTYAKSVNTSRNGKNAWVFDIDETLLSNVPYYADHEFGSGIFDEVTFNKWVELAAAPALPVSLRLYKELQKLGFTIVLLTGRDESHRNVTRTNLWFAGYTN